MTDASDITDLKIMVARIEERQKSEGLEADHRYGNLKQSIQGLVSRHEHTSLERRVEDVENTLKWMVRSAVAINTAIAAGMAAVGKKLGLWT